MYIYKLWHPSSDKVYIGATKDPKARFSGHWAECRNPSTAKEFWLKGLRDSKIRPFLTILEKCKKKEWEELEIYWIDKYRKEIGPERVLNVADGGKFPYRFDSTGIKHTEETKKKIKAHWTPKERKRMKRKMLGNNLNDLRKLMLNKEQIKQIREIYSLGNITYQDLCKAFRVNISTIQGIISNKYKLYREDD